MSELTEYGLLDLCDLLDSKRIPLSRMERDKRKGSFPYYGASGIVDYIDDFIFSQDTILISEDGENLQSRKTPIAFKATGRYWVNNHAHVLLPKKQHYFPIIINYLESMDLSTFITGAVQPKLSQSNLEQISILLPFDENEQKAIAGVLSSLDDKIDLLHRQNKTLEALAETMFRQWFVETQIEGSEEMPLHKLCNIINGFAFQSGTYKDNGNKIIRTLNFSGHFIELDSLVFLSDDLAGTFSKYNLNRADFLLVMVGASIGNYAIVTKDILPALQNQNMWCFRVKEGFSQHYLNQALQKLIDDNIHNTSGSARDFFQKAVWYEYKISIPPRSSMQAYDEVCEKMFCKIENNRCQISMLETLRSTLLPKLMSGETKIKEVDNDHTT